ncbi:MAG TPA: aminotransferase class V-fold PLP-dependent enzyme [Acidimicrobiia bacterium]|nr:aminotransferase class V-fold PLP-dependent enzyme [Acidimicrobiia bacterium]
MASVFDRSDYQTLSEGIYLNQAALGLLSNTTVASMHSFLDDVGRHGNLHMSDDDEAAFLSVLRARAARLWRTEPGRIAILSSAGELLGQIPYLLPPPAGAEVIVVGSDFPAVTRPWLRLVERDECRLRFVEDDPATDLTADIVAAINDRTSLVAVGSVQYATGSLVDVPRLRLATRAVGARLVVDATQGAGAIETNVADWDADIVVGSGYKWLGGHGGVAIGAIEPSILERTPPLPGWMGAPDPFDFDARRMPLADDARRYTQSTMSYVSVVGLSTALDQLLPLGREAVGEHASRLARRLVGTVAAHGWRPFRDLDDPSASSHIISLGHPDRPVAGSVARLRAAGIVCGTRGGRIRVSLAGYNDEGDVDALARVLA